MPVEPAPVKHAAAPAPAPAGLARRFAAMLYDSLLMAAALYAAAIPAVWLHGGAVPPDALFWFRAWLAFVAWLYLAVSWTRGGQTLGMRAWRCRLVAADGGPIGWGRTVVRFAGAIVSWAALGLGFWWALADPERRTWHDRWSGTRIIVLPR